MSAYPESQAERENLLQYFDLPKLVFTVMGHRCNGYFGGRESHDDTGKLKGYCEFSGSRKYDVC